MTRYALYFAPASNTPWHQAGCRWLGRDAFSGSHNPQINLPGLPAVLLESITADARRYGFHATLKAPFRLAEGFSESHLLAMAQAFADVQKPICLEGLAVATLDGFLALRPSGGLQEIGALAQRCVSYFDMLRAAPSQRELSKRRRAALSERQEALLQRWGYPYTEEEFRFHMTLCDSLRGIDDCVKQVVVDSAKQCFASAASRGMPALDALTIFREDAPGAPFTVWKRLPFRSGATSDEMLPAKGRLFYIVGPSGAGKDTLLQWVRERSDASAQIVFARRTISRPSHSSELHEAVDTATFLRLEEAGQFAMSWQANGSLYGIRRGIEADLAAGRDVVVNGSRAYLPQLQQLFPDASVIWVDASPDQIRQRIEARRRESGPALLRRIERAVQFEAPDDDAVVRLDNSGSIEVAGERLMQILAQR